MDEGERRSVLLDVRFIVGEKTMMRRVATATVAGLFAVAFALPSQAVEVPKITMSPAISKVSAPADHQLRFGPHVSKHQSRPQTAWVCFTPGGSCNVPGLGFCYCCFPWGCYNGHT